MQEFVSHIVYSLCAILEDHMPIHSNPIFCNQTCSWLCERGSDEGLSFFHKYETLAQIGEEQVRLLFKSFYYSSDHN
jgi:hypothetical protein